MNNLKKIFFTSDLHIFHEACIGFDDRPFSDIYHMHEVLANNFNSTVPEGSIVYYLGDIGFHKGDRIKAYFERLVSHTRVLCLGNHDGGSNAMYNQGFDVVLTGASMQIAKNRVTMSHCPLLDTYRENTEDMVMSSGEPWHGNNRKLHRSVSFVNSGQFHIHGHCHSPNKGKSKKILGRQYDVGVVNSSYRPVSISTIESWIAKTLQEEKHGLRG